MKDSMKNFLSLFIAALLIGFAIFAVAHWVFRESVSDSLGIAIPVTIAGVVTELLRPYLIKKKKVQ